LRSHDSTYHNNDPPLVIPNDIVRRIWVESEHVLLYIIIDKKN